MSQGTTVDRAACGLRRTRSEVGSTASSGCRTQANNESEFPTFWRNQGGRGLCVSFPRGNNSRLVPQMYRPTVIRVLLQHLHDETTPPAFVESGRRPILDRFGGDDVPRPVDLQEDTRRIELDADVFELDDS